MGWSIDVFQMPIKHLTSGGQACNQEAAVQQTFHLVGSIFSLREAASFIFQH